MYCVFNALYNFEESVRKFKIDFFEERFKPKEYTLDFISKNRDQNITPCALELANYNGPLTNDIVINVVSNYFSENVISQIKDSSIKEIVDFFNIAKRDFANAFIEFYFGDEFGGQTQNIYKKGPSNVRLCIKDSSININIENNKPSCTGVIDLKKQVLYIDNPFVLDNLKNQNKGSQHRSSLIKAIKKERNKNLADEFFINRKFNKIIERITSVCDGDIAQEKDQSYLFHLNGTDKNLSLQNLSTGMKTFAIIKTLLLNGSLEQNGTIILDEPEIHLHPEWQKILAEIIVLIQIEFEMHILINSHSPYFIESIDFYEQKYGLRSDCRFYLSSEEDENHSVTFLDVSDDLQPIYALLYHPLELLDQERESIQSN